MKRARQNALEIPVSFSNKVENNSFVKELQKTTTARIGIGHAGGRYPTKAQLKFKEDLAISKDAVHRDVPDELLKKLTFINVKSRARDRKEYLINTQCGRFLDDESVDKLTNQGIKNADFQLIVSEGLSTEAFEKNVPEMLPLFNATLSEAGIKCGAPIFARWARVALMDHIGEILMPKASLIFIGERPGLGISDSLSAYFEYEPRLARVESDRNVLSNIHRLGVPPTEAAIMLARAMIQVIQNKKSGMSVRFDFT